MKDNCENRGRTNITDTRRGSESKNPASYLRENVTNCDADSVEIWVRRFSK